jgi:hypothetical protein
MRPGQNHPLFLGFVLGQPLRSNSLRAKTDTGGSFPPSVVGIDPSGLVADTLARREALGFALV